VSSVGRDVLRYVSNIEVGLGRLERYRGWLDELEGYNRAERRAYRIRPRGARTRMDHAQTVELVRQRIANIERNLATIAASDEALAELAAGRWPAGGAR
jgi:hypothetical protein